MKMMMNRLILPFQPQRQQKQEENDDSIYNNPTKQRRLRKTSIRRSSSLLLGYRSRNPFSSSIQQMLVVVVVVLVFGSFCDITPRMNHNSNTIFVNAASRFGVSGPVVTITVKDPLQFIDNNRKNENNNDDDDNDLNDDEIIDSGRYDNRRIVDGNEPFIDLSSIRPNVQWNIYSRGPPLPNWFPALQSIKASLGYQYNDLKRLPAWIETTFKLALPGYETSGNELQIQPSYQFKNKQKNLLVQLNRGANYIFVQLSNQQKRFVEIIRGSIIWNVPSASISSIRVTPTVNVATKDINCCIETITGGGGKTRAILNLEYTNPTLAILYSPNERNLLSPEISLYTANIIYQWQLLLGKDCTAGSFIMKVDPASSIYITWTDNTIAGGSWVTDVRIPLEGTTVRSLAADVRVRRQFQF